MQHRHGENAAHQHRDQCARSALDRSRRRASRHRADRPGPENGRGSRSRSGGNCSACQAARLQADDYGKFKYREAKKAHEAKLKQKQIHIREVKFRPGTHEGDYKIKLRNLIKFLDEGDKTKVTLRYRGREMAHQEFGVRLIERVKQDLEPHAVVEQYPKMEGRQLIMVLAPKKGKKEIKKPVKKEAKKEPKKEAKPEVSL